MKLVISLATRGRPQQLVDTILRSTVHLALPNTVMMVQVDDDDRMTIAALSAARLDSRVMVNIKPREDNLGEKWNRAVAEPADAYVITGDDDPYVTPGFDAKLLEAAAVFPDGIGMAYGRLANASFSCAVCPTAGFVEKLGHIFPNYFPYWFVDHWTDDIARMIGRVSFADVATDQTRAGATQEMREPGWWATFFDAGYRMRRHIALQILDDPKFQTPDWQKDMLRRQIPAIEYRSRWVNDNVRSISPNLAGILKLGVKDDRYQRVKARAIETLKHFLDDYGMEPAEADKFRRILTPPTSIRSIGQAYAHSFTSVSK